MSTLRNQVRIERTKANFKRSQVQILTWLEHSRELDRRQQYSSQLNNLETFFTRLFSALDGQVNGIAPGAETSSVYQVCHTVDQKLVWLHEVWRYYAEKFNQRGDPGGLGRVMQAADELVWSCYAGFYKNTPGAARMTAPLPYIEPLYTPTAIPRDQPGVLRNRFIESRFFQEFLRELPVPVIGLPQACVEEPWWLVYIGHEVGHHIQHDLLPDNALVGKFGAWLEAAALRAGGSARRASRWRQWGQEVFADAFSVYTLGRWAAFAMTELIFSSEAAMLTELETYPAPAVRLELLASLAATLEQDGQATLQGFDPGKLTTGDPLKDAQELDLRKEAGAHLGLAPVIVQAIADYSFEGLGTFKKLTGWQASDFRPGGSIDDWAARLRERRDLSDKKRLDYPRLIASAGLAAWAEISAIAQPAEREEAKSRLVARFLKQITESGPEDKREAAGLPIAMGLEEAGDQLARQFMEISLEDLGL